MKQTTIVAVVLGLLVVLSAFQAFQLTSLKAKVTDGELSVNTGSSTTTTQTGSQTTTSALPDNLKNLPEMVGGC